MMIFFRKLWAWLLCYRNQETAATAIEYALLVAFIGVFIMGAVLSIGGYLEGFYETITGYITSVQ